MLEIKNLNVNYGVIQAVKNISFKVSKGKIVSIIGSNGAGKTSTLNAIVSSAKKYKIKQNHTQILFENKDITSMPTYKIVQDGIALVPEGRKVFINLTIEENLKLGAYNSKDDFETQRDKMYELFPRLKLKANQLARTLSGGEQQMLALCRALISKPKLLILDEPSLGLAPKITKEVFKILKNLNQEGLTILLVEQNAFLTLKNSDYTYVLENGEITLEGASNKLLDDDTILRRYLG